MLTIGDRFSHYVITGKLGEGGMGEVYRADDTKLKREVAIKVLPEAFARDEERMKRFEREAQVLASLNHPNIAAIYGLEEVDGVRALVLELVEGPTLAERIDSGALPLEEAVGIARQIAVGLEAAHEKSVVHRDLKPPNIKLTQDGLVKLLDFGLAKALEGDGISRNDVESSNSPTLTRAGTQAGALLGTAAYMSPEQAKGKPVDRRADVWAFGAVLFEMLTGARLFSGETASETLASVIKDEPSFERLPAATPPHIRRLLRRCLTKDPRERLQAIGEARIAIDRPEVEAGVAADKERIAVPALILAGVAIVAALWGWLARVPTATTAAASIEAMLEPGVVRFLDGKGLALSPDGMRLAFVGMDASGNRAIWIRPLDGRDDVVRVPGTVGGSWPFWSPDGRTLGFAAGDEIQTVEIASGTKRTLCKTSSNEPNGDWSPDGVILFPHDGGLYRTDPRGSDCRLVTAPEEGRGRLQEPVDLGDDQHFAFRETVDIRLGDLRTGDHELWIEQAVSPHFVAPDWVLYARNPVGGYDVGLPTLLAQRFDPDTFELRGPPSVVLPGVATPSGNASFSAASNGVLVAVDEDPSFRPSVWVDRTGRVVDTTMLFGDTWTYSLSRDGKKMALGGWGLWIYELERGAANRLTVEEQVPQVTFHPAWSPDSATLAFVQLVGGAPKLRVYHVQEDRTETLFESPGRNLRGISWSPNGADLAFWRFPGDDATEPELWAYSMESAEARKLFAAPGGLPSLGGCDYCLGFSPDGRWLLYVAVEDGTPQVYLRAYPELGPAIRVSTGGGNDAHWAPDGSTIYYLAPTGSLMAVAVGAAPSRDLSTPEVVVDAPEGHGLFGVSSDGRRFLRRQGDGLPVLKVITAWQQRAEQPDR